MCVCGTFNDDGLGTYCVMLSEVAKTLKVEFDLKDSSEILCFYCLCFAFLIYAYRHTASEILMSGLKISVLTYSNTFSRVIRCNGYFICKFFPPQRDPPERERSVLLMSMK